MPTTLPYHETPHAAKAYALWTALEALCADESLGLQETLAFEQLHDAYEDLTGFCFADARDPRSYETPEAWREGLRRDWCADEDQKREAGRLLEQGYRITLNSCWPG